MMGVTQTLTSNDSILDLWNITLESTEAKVRSFSLLETNYSPQTKKKSEINKAMRLFWGNEDHKDRLTAVSEYHPGSNNTYY